MAKRVIGIVMTSVLLHGCSAITYLKEGGEACLIVGMPKTRLSTEHVLLKLHYCHGHCVYILA